MDKDRESGSVSRKNPAFIACDEEYPELSVEQALFSQDHRWGFLASILIELLPITVWMLVVLGVGALVYL